MQVVAVTGGKGGVGKTNVAVNLSVALSKLGKDVVLFDADLGLANVDLLMGLSISHTLADVVSGEKLVSDVVVNTVSGVRVIPAASGIPEMVNLSQESRSELIRGLSDQLAAPEVMIVDTGAGIDQTVQTVVAACQIPVLVVCDEPASLTDCYALIKVLRHSKILNSSMCWLIRLTLRTRAKIFLRDYRRLRTSTSMLGSLILVLSRLIPT